MRLNLLTDSPTALDASGCDGERPHHVVVLVLDDEAAVDVDLWRPTARRARAYSCSCTGASPARGWRAWSLSRARWLFQVGVYRGWEAYGTNRESTGSQRCGLELAIKAPSAYTRPGPKEASRAGA